MICGYQWGMNTKLDEDSPPNDVLSRWVCPPTDVFSKSVCE